MQLIQEIYPNSRSKNVYILQYKLNEKVIHKTLLEVIHDSEEYFYIEPISYNPSTFELYPGIQLKYYSSKQFYLDLILNDEEFINSNKTSENILGCFKRIELKTLNDLNLDA